MARRRQGGALTGSSPVQRRVAGMETLRARVEKGRLVLDEPTALPEGTVLELCVAQAEDELDSEERAAL